MNEELTVPKAKKLLKGFLDDKKLGYSKLTGRTVDFTDLARVVVVFVCIHDFKCTDVTNWNDVKAFAVQYGFRVTTP